MTSQNNIVYVALWSLPGCLPEMEPARFDNFTDAKQFLVDEAKDIRDRCENDSDAFAWEDVAIEIDHASDAPVIKTAPDGYIYKVSTDVE